MRRQLLILACSLKFLRDRPDSIGSNTLLDVFEARREDVVHVLLNC